MDTHGINDMETIDHTFVESNSMLVDVDTPVRRWGFPFPVPELSTTGKNFKNPKKKISSAVLSIQIVSVVVFSACNFSGDF